MNLGIATHVGVTQPVLPCAVDVPISYARRDLDPIVRIPSVEQLFRNYLDRFLDVLFAYPPGPQPDGGNGFPRRRRVVIHGRRR